MTAIFVIVEEVLPVAAEGDLVARIFANRSVIHNARLVADADLVATPVHNLSVIRPARLVAGAADVNLIATIVHNTSSFGASELQVAPPDGNLRATIVHNVSSFGASELQVAPPDVNLRATIVHNVSSFGASALEVVAVTAGAGASVGTSTAAAASGEIIAAAGASAGSSTAAATGVMTSPGAGSSIGTAGGVAGGTALVPAAGASAGTSTAAAGAVALVPAAGSSAGTSTAAAASPVPVTLWDATTPTGRGPNIALSNGNLTATGKTLTIGIALDLDNKRMWGRVGASAWSGSGNPAANTGGNDITSVVSGSVFPAWSAFNSSVSDRATINGGALPFEAAVPAGFTAIGSAITWDPSNKDASITLSNGNLTATGAAPGSNAWKSVRATIGKTSGKWYFEVEANVVDTGSGWMLGCENASGSLPSYIGSSANGAGYTAFPQYYINGGNTTPVLARSFAGPYSAAWRSIRSTTHHTSGKWYVELACDVLDGGQGWAAGVTNVSGPLANQVGSDNNSTGFQTTRQFWKNNTGTSNVLPNALTAGHVLCLAIDLDNNRIWGRVDGNAWSGTSGNPATNTGGQDIASVNDGVGVYLGFSTFDQASVFDQATLNTGGSGFAYTAPAGFSPWA